MCRPTCCKCIGVKRACQDKRKVPAYSWAKVVLPRCSDNNRYQVLPSSNALRSSFPPPLFQCFILPNPSPLPMSRQPCIHPSIHISPSLSGSGSGSLPLYLCLSLYPGSLLPGPVRFLFLISFIVRYIRRRCLQTSERTPETTADRRQRCHHYEDNALSLSFTMMTSRLSSILRLVCLAIIIICCNRQLLSSSRNPWPNTNSLIRTNRKLHKYVSLDTIHINLGCSYTILGLYTNHIIIMLFTMVIICIFLNMHLLVYLII